MIFFCLFVWFDSLRPINNLSVIKGRVFLVRTSTKLGLMFLLKDTTQWRWWGLNPRPLGLESSTLPLSHCAPKCDILKKCVKKSTLAKISSVWCFLKSTRPVYYQLYLNLIKTIKTSLKTIFLQKIIFLHFNPKPVDWKTFFFLKDR